MDRVLSIEGLAAFNRIRLILSGLGPGCFSCTGKAYFIDGKTQIWKLHSIWINPN